MTNNPSITRRRRGRPLDVNDRLFLQEVHAYLRTHDLPGLTDDPVDGYQLVISYRRVKPALRKVA